jgi:hypothetical protein
LANLTGAATPPASSLILAYVLVPAGATSIVTADILNLARRIQPALPPLAPYVAAASIPVTAGYRVLALPGTTMTLPTPTVGAYLSIVATSAVTAASPVTVAASGGALIYGAGLNGAASFLLGAACAAVELQSFDGIGWVITSGQQDTGWIALPLTGGALTPYNPGTPYGVLAARLVGDMVSMRGSVAGASSGTATLPASMHPSVQRGINSVAVIPTTGVISFTGTYSLVFDGASFSL